jgi:hypothetical protein
MLQRLGDGASNDAKALEHGSSVRVRGTALAWLSPVPQP